MARGAYLAIRPIVRTESEVVIAVSGELDMSTIDALVAEVDAQLQPPIQSLTLDLQELTFMDSTGLRLLIELNDRAQQGAWRLRLIRPRHDAASRVLQITGADAALPFEREDSP
ncbi:MAG TPA: STAS domain-containing protein [Solirubrobacteraceae bacterium]|nr:STAS domain-containing protein [Solirubrobacteraceae bacterium]